MTTREQAKQVEALLQAHFPGADIDVMRIPGGLQIEIHAPGSTMFAVLGSEDSAVLAALVD